MTELSRMTRGRRGFRAYATVLGLTLGLQTAWSSGFLTLETNPSGAEIWYAPLGGLERRYLGDSPIQSREIIPGQYDFWVIVENRDTLSLPGITVYEGQHTQISRELPLHYAFLHLTTEPDSGEIHMDDINLGLSPYTNPLVHPNTYTLQLLPKSNRYRPRQEKLTLKKGDSLDLYRPFSYRDKAFLWENLSVLPGRVQLESGIWYRSLFGFMDSTGKRKNFPNENVKSQIDLPLTLRLGLPYGIEGHVLIPFKSYEKMNGAAPFASDLAFGLKYTLRPYNIGLDADYAVGRSAKNGGLNHDVLTLQLLGMLDKDKLLFQGNAGFQFHMHDNSDRLINPGNQIFLRAQAGYVAGAVMPYLAAMAGFHLSGDRDGEDLDNANYHIDLEPGLTLDVQDWVSFQLGIPFAALGSETPVYWGIHLSFAARFGFIDG